MENTGDICIENECIKLFEAAINTQSDLIVLLYDHTPVIFNKAFLDFSNVSSARQFLREFGALPSRFVPHDDYFHMGKTSNPDQWAEELMDLPEDKRIISMLNWRIEPHAFSITVTAPLQDYLIITFKDISQEMIKRIMIENDANLDSESGAYAKDYFVHTAKSFLEASEFNQKKVGITMIRIMDTDTPPSTLASSIKRCVRQSDMLVRWSANTYLLAYFIDTQDNASNITRKLLIQQSANGFSLHLGTTMQREKEGMNDMIRRAEEALKNCTSSPTSVLF